MDADLNLGVLLGCVTVLVSAVAVRLSDRARVPALLLYLALGMTLGEAGLGVDFENYEITADLGFIALAIVLAEGGLTTRWSQIRPVIGASVLLATIGVATSTAVVAVASHVLLGTDWRTSVILGAVVSSTDAVAVFTVLRGLPLAPRPRHTLEAESGLNDATAVVLVAFASSDEWFDDSVPEMVAQIAFELSVGALVGIAVGLLGAAMMRSIALPSAGIYPLAVLSIALLAFTAANAAHVSGFAAVYLTALVLGNSHLPHRRSVLGFAGSLSLLAEIGLFVLLGLLASPDRLPDALLDALVVGAAATLLARPLAVLVSTSPFRMPWREQAFLSWAGLRGAVPIVLAIIPVTEGLPGSTRILDVVLVLVVVYTLVQATPLEWLAALLGVTTTGRARELEVDVAPLDELRADMLQVAVPPGSRLQGVYVYELRLPPPAQVVLVVREARPFMPDTQTVLATGDTFLVVVPSDVRDATEARLRAVAGRGKLAGWLGG